jgi:Glyoxalase-like domain
MTFAVQVVVDCVDPHALADWWAETLGWPVEQQDEAFIRRMVAEGHATDDDTRLYNGRLVWRVGAAIKAAEPQAQQLRILFQLVPERKAVKNRLHFDIRTGETDVVQVRQSLVDRGATVLHEGRLGASSWVTMTDPEGNEFCL